LIKGKTISAENHKVGAGGTKFRFVMKEIVCKKQSFNDRKIAGITFLFLIPVLFFAGCATSTIQSRENENAAVYASFSPEVKSLVNHGQIRAGMSTNAVYMAWGPPEEILQNGNTHGVFKTWIYRGGFLEDTQYWAGRRYPYLAHDYEPRTYIRAEIIFANGIVQSWRTLPEPAH
jgi:hypothetical protein